MATPGSTLDFEIPMHVQSSHVRKSQRPHYTLEVYGVDYLTESRSVSLRGRRVDGASHITAQGTITTLVHLHDRQSCLGELLGVLCIVSFGATGAVSEYEVTEIAAMGKDAGLTHTRRRETAKQDQGYVAE